MQRLPALPPRRFLKLLLAEGARGAVADARPRQRGRRAVRLEGWHSREGERSGPGLLLRRLELTFPLALLGSGSFTTRPRWPPEAPLVQLATTYVLLKE